MSQDPEFASIHEALLEGIKNIDKWYNKVDDSPAYFITLGMSTFSNLN
jgi:uncharacterized protein HemY